MSRIWEALQRIDHEYWRNSKRPGPHATGEKGDFVLRMPATGTGADNAEAVLRSVPNVKANRFDCIPYHTDPSSHAADKFRMLRLSVAGESPAGVRRSLLVTSPLPEDGKTTIALNLAFALCESQTKRVLVVDADLHRGSICQRFGIEKSTGLAECLQNNRDPFELLKKIEPGGLYLLASGLAGVANPTELIQTSDLKGVFQRLIRHFDWIVVDSPPVLALTDAIALSQVVDKCLMIGRSGSTPAKALERAIELLGRKKIAGLVLNALDQPSSAKYADYYRRPDAILAAETEQNINRA